jgi:choice-of-anchor A domain-containing protein
VSYGGVLIEGTASVLGGYVHEKPFDFTKYNQKMLDDSASLAAQTPNGSVASAPSGGVLLTGTKTGLNVFEVAASAITGLTIQIPAGSTALINVTGTTVSLQNFQVQLKGGASADHIFYNMPQATQLNVSGISVLGSILAPKATLLFNNGNINGQLIVYDLKGGGESHNVFFKGCVPICEW